MKIIECAQGTPEWHKARLGIPTASNFSKIVTGDGSPSKQAQGYLYEVVAERITGRAAEIPTTAAMEEGIRREEESRLVYAMTREAEVEQVGFCLEDAGRWGCSPDGFVGNFGLLELKNPTDKRGVEYLLRDKLPAEYVQQVQGGLFVTGRDWCDFVSYVPGLPLFLVRAERDEEFIKKLEAALIGFSEKLEKAVGMIKSR